MKQIAGLLIYAAISLLLIFLTIANPAAILFTTSSAFGAWAVWRIVRRFNDRETPPVNRPAPTPDDTPETD